MDLPVATIRVDSRIRLSLREIGEEAAQRIRKRCEHDNPNRSEGRLRALEEAARKQRGSAQKRAWGLFFAAKKQPRTFATWAEDGDEFSLPRGRIRDVYEVLDDLGIEDQVVDERSLGDSNLRPDYLHSPVVDGVEVPLYDFQREYVAAGLERENTYWRSGTGTGKTTAALAFAVAAGVPALVVVWTGNLHDQWRERCLRELRHRDGRPLRASEVGVVRGKERLLRPVTIAMEQTLHAMPPEELSELSRHFGALVCDELDRYGAKTFAAVVDRCACRYRIGVSADERRKDRLEFLIYDSFGSQSGPDIARSELVARGVVVDVELVAVESEFCPDWYRSLPPAARPTAHNRLVDEMTADEDRSALVVGIASADYREGEQVIVFTHRVEHARRLEADFRAAHPGIGGEETGLLLGGDERASEFRRVADGLRTGACRAAFGTYQAIAYGLDLPSVSRGVAATPQHSNPKVLNQVRGRLCRASAGKGKGRLSVVWDRRCFGARPLRVLAKLGSAFVSAGGELIPATEYLRGLRDEANE